MPPPVLMNLVVFPPGCGDSAADFWGWGAHEAQLSCPSAVSGDMHMKISYQDGPLSLSLLITQTMVTMGNFPYQENSHDKVGNRTRDLMISSQKPSPLDHEAGLYK